MVNWYQAPKIGSRLGPFLPRGVIQEGLTGVVFVAVNTVIPLPALPMNAWPAYSTTGEFAHALSQAIAPPGASHWDTVVMPYPSSATSRPNPELRQDS